MNYEAKKDSVIFDIPLHDYFGVKKVYNQETKCHDEHPINSIQSCEEDLFLNFESFGLHISSDQIEDDDKQEAIKYLISKKYTKEEIDSFSGTLESDLLRAYGDAKDDSYQAQWMKEYMRLTQDQIWRDLAEALDNKDEIHKDIEYKLLDNLEDKDFRRNKNEQEYLRLSFLKKDIIQWLKENYPDEEWHKDKDYIDYFHDYALDYTRKPIDTEYIDRYGSLGDCSDWFDYFKEQNEIGSEIDEYRKDEKDKVNNVKRLLDFTIPKTDEIKKYTEKYMKNEGIKKITIRQTNALTSAIKKQIDR